MTAAMCRTARRLLAVIQKDQGLSMDEYDDLRDMLTEFLARAGADVGAQDIEPISRVRREEIRFASEHPLRHAAGGVVKPSDFSRASMPALTWGELRNLIGAPIPSSTPSVAKAPITERAEEQDVI